MLDEQWADELKSRRAELESAAEELNQSEPDQLLGELFEHHENFCANSGQV